MNVNLNIRSHLLGEGLAGAGGEDADASVDPIFRDSDRFELGGDFSGKQSFVTTDRIFLSASRAQVRWTMSSILMRGVQRVVATLSLGLAAATSGTAGPVTLADIPDFLKADFDPDRLAFAYYDYRLTSGLEGQYTYFEEGPLSLFDESQSGISSVEGFSWVEGTGWVSTGSTMTFRWKNVRVKENVKNFRQAVTLSNDTVVTGVTPSTDSPDDAIDRIAWAVFDEAGFQGGSLDLNGDGDRTDRVLIINARITPQPDDVFVKVTFQGTLVEQGWVLDQCTPIPEPSSLVLAVLGLIGPGAGALAQSRARRYRKISGSTPPDCI